MNFKEKMYEIISLFDEVEDFEREIEYRKNYLEKLETKLSKLKDEIPSVEQNIEDEKRLLREAKFNLAESTKELKAKIK